MYVSSEDVLLGSFDIDIGELYDEDEESDE